MRCAVERREIMYCKKFIVHNYMNIHSRVSYASKKGQRSLMGPNFLQFLMFINVHAHLTYLKIIFNVNFQPQTV